MPAATAASGGAIVLLHHIDTVPAGDGWRHPAHAGEVHDGELWGRGAIDAKGLGIAHLEAFLDLARSPLRLRRPVVFLAVADEEAGGGEGAGWLLEAHPELFENVAVVLNEGGVNKAVAGRPLFWGIEVDQKRPLWLDVVAAGRPGHASAANPESATHRLVAGLARLRRGAAPAAGHPGGDRLPLRARPLRPAGARHWRLSDASAGRRDRRAVSLPGLESLLSDTVQITTLAASDRINVVAAEARAGIDVRLLPDTDEKAFVAELERILGPELTVSVRLVSAAAPPSSATSAVFRTLAAALAAGNAAPVVPAFIPAFTDSRYFRARGIAAYGFSPFALDGLPAAHRPRAGRAHSARLTLDRGVETMTRVVRASAPLSASDRSTVNPHSDSPALAGERAALPLLLAACSPCSSAPLADPAGLLATRDIVEYHLPMRIAFAQLASSAFRSGIRSRTVANRCSRIPTTARFYPLSWLALLFPPAVALNLLVLIHAALAAWGALRLARRLGAGDSAALLAAVAYTCGPTFLSLLHSLTIALAMSFLPWVIEFALALLDAPPGQRTRGAGAGLSLSLAAIFLLGDPLISP